MKIAVCVKYVPVVSRIQFDYEKKTIIRDGVPSEINPFDLLGLVRAVELKSSPDDQVVVISMGPPNAKEGLTQCLALGADRAVLITDRALAGSDTLATARALALALGREEPDLIICGRNSADAETGQVIAPRRLAVGPGHGPAIGRQFPRQPPGGIAKAKTKQTPLSPAHQANSFSRPLSVIDAQTSDMPEGRA